MSERHTAILLLAHGTPDKLDEMAPYLHHVTGGRPMPQHVIEELQHRYAEIGLRDKPLPEGPPLTRWTLLQGKLLAAETRQPVYVGMRNWHPFIADTVAQMKADGVTHARVLCLAPQYSRTSVGLYKRAFEKALAETPGDAFTYDFIAGWANEALLAQAFAENLWPVWAEACAATSAAANLPVRVPVLFTAHAVPCRTIMSGSVSNPASPSARPGAPVPAEGIQNYGETQTPDPYPVECKDTANRIAGKLRTLGMTGNDWYFAFQSQGIAGAPWIGPSVPDTLKALAETGHKAVVFQPVGFLCDHVEILYDIDIDFKEQAAELGMKIYRAPSLNNSLTLIRALAHVLA